MLGKNLTKISKDWKLFLRVCFPRENPDRARYVVALPRMILKLRIAVNVSMTLSTWIGLMR
jgi:hypothetical protein